MSDSSHSELKPGDVIDGKYKVERDLGIGGMGRVVLALHLGLDELVALKVLHDEATRDPEAVARFAREAKAAARIKSEHVARVLDVSALGGKMPYIVMEYLEGSDLEQVVDANGAIPYEEAVDYVLQACEALAEAHARGVIHRDLKPGNLHLSKRADGSPMVKILDFGISKISTRDNGGSMTSTSALLGSPLYMSPEQMKATRDVDARADIWAMGVVLYELLTARSPFQAPSMPQVCARVLDTPPDSLAPQGLPTALEAVVMKCLEKKPENRFRDVAAFAHALEPFAPARSAISIERIVKVIGSPSSSGEFRLANISTSDAFFPRAVSASAPTLSEEDLVQRETMPMPAPIPRIGGETMTNATLSANGFLTDRKKRRTATYGAAAFVASCALLVAMRSHSHPSVAAESPPQPSAPVVVAADVATATTTLAPAPVAMHAPTPTPTAAISKAATVNTTIAETQVAPTPSSIPTTATAPSASSKPGHKRAQDLSKLFGGRE